MWNLYTEPIINLEAEDINKIVENQNTLKSEIEQKYGTSVPALYQENASYSTPISQVKSIVNGIQANCHTLNSTNFVWSPFFKANDFQTYAPNTEDVWNWILTLNDLHLIASSFKSNWGHLLCNDGYPTITGKRILCWRSL